MLASGVHNTETECGLQGTNSKNNLPYMCMCLSTETENESTKLLLSWASEGKGACSM